MENICWPGVWEREPTIRHAVDQSETRIVAISPCHLCTPLTQGEIAKDNQAAFSYIVMFGIKTHKNSF